MADLLFTKRGATVFCDTLEVWACGDEIAVDLSNGNYPGSFLTTTLTREQVTQLRDALTAHLEE